ncbi:MAG: YkgJ family cysteine cluster protein [Planctomycetes bacterium]|nr:YkgJ family cysteine cluster protein [Planctomycetota bacterium]
MHPCAICASRQKTCCQGTEILVTRGDIERITQHSGRSGFHERRRPTDPDYVEWDPEDPQWLDLTVAPDGTRLMLQREATGDCVFLGSEGCVLETEVRPLVCRIYPYAFSENGVQSIEPEYCPTTTLCAPGQTMADVLGMNLQQAEAWRSELYAELHADAPSKSGSAR